MPNSNAAPVPPAHEPILFARRIDFIEFHEANPQVWDLFERFCLKMIEAGQSGFGAPVIWERIRWEVVTDTKSKEPYRLPNIHRPFYARMFQQRHPELAHHISTRPLRVISRNNGEDDSAERAVA